MTNTVIVEVVRSHAHALYKKILRRRARFAAHNTLESLVVGDVVKIIETAPISKTKHFTVTEKV